LRADQRGFQPQKTLWLNSFVLRKGVRIRAVPKKIFSLDGKVALGVGCGALHEGV
jgi:hypothetical protein